MNRKLPQICRHCRNRRVGGRPLTPDQGTFKKVAGRCHDWKWVCHECQPPGAPTHEPSRYKPSWLERQIAPVLAASGFQFKPQHTVEKFRFDFYVPKLALIIEGDGRWAHASRSRQARDRAKTALAESRGWKVVCIPNGPDIRGRVQAALALRAAEILDHQ